MKSTLTDISYQRMRRKSIDLVIYLILAFFFIFHLATLDYSYGEPMVLITFFILGIFYFYRIVTAKKHITLYRVFYIFSFIFMFYAPLQQYLSGTIFWVGNGLSIYYSHQDYLNANILLIVFTACFEIGYRLFRSKRKEKKSYIVIPSDFAEMVLLTVSIGTLLILAVTGNITGRAGLDVENESVSSQILNILRFIPIACFIVTYLYRKMLKDSLSRWIIFIYAAEILVVYFPLNGSISRFLLFGAYLAIFSLIFSKCQYKSILFLCYVVGFFFIFSAFNYFKSHNISDLSGFSLGLVDFNQVDYDAYQLLMCSMKYVQEVGTFSGQNLLTVLLCFIPRSLWPGKMQPSGSIIFTYFQSQFTNVSCPIMAEYFLAFGYFGVVLGALFTGWLFRKIDGFDDSTSYFKKGVFCIASGLLIYILRGAMLPTVSYTLALIISLGIVIILARVSSYVYVNRRSSLRQTAVRL